MKLKLLDKLSKDFTELLGDTEDYNVIIEIGVELNKKSFTAHSAVLRYRSSYFRRELAKTVTNENHKELVRFLADITL
ncbi:3362_t:CDS:2 [Acaulospora colombiana]|uniref:3362_t:CDS:1 n=1 Tax=Acaulospora colombiana TaxID=27376 RepID=A0ACA9K974_9GLOM|nr:3362_t:CDS:2 [Acaulospora colombiana]